MIGLFSRDCACVLDFMISRQRFISEVLPDPQGPCSAIQRGSSEVHDKMPFAICSAKPMRSRASSSLHFIGKSPSKFIITISKFYGINQILLLIHWHLEIQS